MAAALGNGTLVPSLQLSTSLCRYDPMLGAKVALAVGEGDAALSAVSTSPSLALSLCATLGGRSPDEVRRLFTANPLDGGVALPVALLLRSLAHSLKAHSSSQQGRSLMLSQAARCYLATVLSVPAVATSSLVRDKIASLLLSLSPPPLADLAVAVLTVREREKERGTGGSVGVQLMPWLAAVLTRAGYPAVAAALGHPQAQPATQPPTTAPHTVTTFGPIF
uniref:Uncharacterized protein n=1 Tax=Sexangularia sp. CB-2014 TaxID=1486929 RepID=A0A7S1YG90_9EUKA